MVKIYIILLVVITGTINISQAQFSVSGEFRPRAEYRHGFKNLPVAGQEEAFFIDQRTRLNLSYVDEKYDLKIVFQDVRTWGSQPQLADNDGSLTTLHEAWARVQLFDHVAVKLGRQEIVYDDHRIFGNVDWAQQARSHDAAIFIFKPKNMELNLGLAYNQDGPQLNTTFYTVANSYKTFQYLWGNRKFGNIQISALLLNNGRQGGSPDDFKTYYSQTFGPRTGYNRGNFKVNFAVYKQTGEEPDASTDINATYIGLDLTYSVMENTSVTAGLEYLTGNNPTDIDNENNAFNPFYGTNHKFNGLMDYFYVGNHLGSVGLQDIFITLNQKMGNVSANLSTHFFSAAEAPYNIQNNETLDKYLGTEVDLFFTFNTGKDISLQGGYSHMLATSSMEAVKGGNKNETSNWAWLMLTIKPLFFTTEKDKDAN
ncbi:hypothetical protein C900_03379 [Fulvivirga imtechensis AK7]|uniref:Alginate export domain-containing protein n=1 Tax=Fulvivirga imtechensis AK7 TaxID=1237149 RepID=L8JPB3_9BACT|nr:alginate export family protein [Fulvivirga imtechensis]ELR70771.1 hypothetical protein C900_03379 [Fulvivirga imtechensis AK7]